MISRVAITNFKSIGEGSDGGPGVEIELKLLTFFVGAIEAQAEFFITANESWLGRVGQLAEEYGVRILTAEAYRGELMP